MDAGKVLDNSFCLSVSEDRESVFASVFDIEFGRHPTTYQGFLNKRDPGAFNCEMGHASIVRMAKSIGMPYVVIFEDDAYPMSGAAKYMVEVLRHVPDDAKMLILGYNKCFGLEKTNEYVSKMTSNNYGSHAYVVFENAYDEYISMHNSNPDATADGFAWILIKPCYVSNKNMFIQRCDKPSMNGWNGYIYDCARHEDPPSEFKCIEDYIGVALDTGSINSMSVNVGLESLKRSDRCLIIGSNPQLIGSGLGSVVDEFEGDVIRINRDPDPCLSLDYGSRTDILFSCDWYQDNVKRSDMPRKIVLNDRTILDVSKGIILDKDKWLTTGMICILMALTSYEDVSILGFGRCDEKEYGVYKSVHDSPKFDISSKDFRHDINREHKMIDVMSRVNFKGKLHILERESSPKAKLHKHKK